MKDEDVEKMRIREHLSTQIYVRHSSHGHDGCII